MACLLMRQVCCCPESGGQRGPKWPREGRFRKKPCTDAALEPPPARSRLRLDRAALLTPKELLVGKGLIRTQNPLPCVLVV